MFNFCRHLKTEQVEEFSILLPESALPKGDDRLGEALWSIGYGDPFPRHFQIGKLIVIHHGEKAGKPATRLILMAREGLTDSEKAELTTEIQLLIGGLVNCEGGFELPTKGWYAEDVFY